MTKFNEIPEMQIYIRDQVMFLAYVYEVMADNLVSDTFWDKLALLVNPSLLDVKFHDEWFRKNYSPSTGSWVWNLPDGLDDEYEILYGRMYQGMDEASVEENIQTAIGQRI